MRTRPHLLLTMAAVLAAIPLGFLACTQNPASSSAGGAGVPHEQTIKDLYKGHFLIGTSGDVPGGFSDQELALVKDNFNIITPENYLKPAPVHPLENVWAFTRPDALVKWCSENGIAVHGHTLMWHSQTNAWFFEGGNKEVVTQRLKNHIMTLVGRYKGKMHSWDVVNEAINDGGGGGGGPGENLRNSQWLQILGPDFLTMAFKFAHEADPDAKLYYNDYNIESGAKHQSSMALLRRLIRDGAPISGVGIQGHWSTSGINYNALDQAITDYASLGLKVSISELDITIAGQSGGQLGPGGPGGRGGGGGRGRGAAPATNPTAGPGAFLMDPDQLFFAQAAPGRGGPGRGGPGRGGMAAPANPADTISATVTDLSTDEQSKLTALATDISAKISQWQASSQAALLSMQPQYSPGQVAYQHELEEYSAEQTKQAGLRDDLINDAEARLNAILTPLQAEKWEAARLNTLFTTQFGALNVTDEQKAKVDPIVSATAKKLAAAKDGAAVASAKADFTKQVLAVLDGAQLAQYKALTNPAPAGRGAGRGGGGGGGGAPASAAGLKAQADAYARIFTIFEKHRNDMDRVTFWGLNDARSWRAGQHPLIFDENNQRKPDYQAIMDVLLHPATTVPTP